MKRILSLVLVLFASVSVFANDWSAAAAKVTKSAVYIENAEGSCTGFVINSAARAKGETDFVLTAAHCDGEKLFVDHVPARVIYKDTQKDLLVLEVEDLSRPALKLAGSNPKIGDQVASYGYGFGLERAMFRTATISDDQSVIPEIPGGPFIQTDAQFVPGQSGGPVVNVSGDVLLIVQRGGGGVGIGVGAETIRAAVGRFFEK
jgi:S1-C subfamily serine protease